MKEVILTGLRANNDLHIGNYFGAMLPMVDMAKSRADQFQINMFIPDLHSFTTPIEHGELYEQVLQNARLFVGAGLPLDNPSIQLYRQSFVPAHSELTWILDCFTGFGQMSRMTQFKEKSGPYQSANRLVQNLRAITSKYNGVVEFFEQDGRFIINGSEVSTEDFNTLKNALNDVESLDNIAEPSVGLFNYPVLMAADILLYSAKYVPVGDDQSQHLEFTRDIAERMNSKFGELFVMPEAVTKQHEFFGKDQGLRIKDLVDPSKKMSKSDDTGKGVIFLGDDPEVAAKKVMGAATDDKASVSYDPVNQPGISNLLDILALLRSKPVSEVAAEFEGMSSYGEFKTVVANEVRQFLVDFQARLTAVDDQQVLAKLEASETAMNAQANETLLRVQQAVGLRPKA